jgi:hypothetical protein
MVDRAALGAAGAPFTMKIELGKVREYIRATLGKVPEGDTPLVPPTFLATQFFWEQDVPGANPWDLVKMSQERGMHAEQEYVFHGPPPRAGDTLYCQSKITDIFDKKGGALVFVVMVTEFRDVDGRLVAEAKLTGVERQ